MPHITRTAGACLVTALLAAGCLDPVTVSGDENIVVEYHPVLPEGSMPKQNATGTPSAVALSQPIQFPHYSHATLLEMQCEYCHADARRSIHAGIPATQVCMGCHQYITVNDSPLIAQVKEYWDSGEPIPWQKVHDLPDFAYFAHKRHVNAGVQCTECHGQVPLKGQKDAAGNIDKVYVRETTLQMGWCLDCHATHPSVNDNYGDKADLRRAELKDCWTCHK